MSDKSAGRNLSIRELSLIKAGLWFCVAAFCLGVIVGCLVGSTLF